VTTAADWFRTPLQYLRGVGPRRAADLERVGLAVAEDLLLRFPLRYEDRADVVGIGRLRPGTTATIMGEVVSSGVRQTRRPGFRLFELIVRDATGNVRAVFPNQAFLRDVFHPGQQVVLYGAVEFRQGLQLSNPEYEILQAEGDDVDETIHAGRIVPIYEKVGSVTPRMQRVLVHRLLAELPDAPFDPLPVGVRQAGHWMDRGPALLQMHFPPAGTNVGELNSFRTPAQQRLIFEEFFLFQSGLLLRARRRASAGKTPCPRPPGRSCCRACTSRRRRKSPGPAGCSSPRCRSGAGPYSSAWNRSSARSGGRGFSL